MIDGAETASAEQPRRLRRRQDFVAAATGKRFHTERLSVQARLRAEPEIRDGAPADGLYVGFTITKRVGHATERNRIRRRLRRAIEHATGSTASPPVDLVVIGRRPALSASFAILVEDLKRALKTANRLQEAKPRSDGAPTGAGGRHDAHVPRRRGSNRPDTQSRSSRTAPHGTIDG